MAALPERTAPRPLPAEAVGPRGSSKIAPRVKTATSAGWRTRNVRTIGIPAGKTSASAAT